MNKKKKWFTSKTLWLGVMTITAGIITVLETNFPMVGWIAVAKGVLDVLMRFATSAPIE